MSSWRQGRKAYFIAWMWRVKWCWTKVNRAYSEQNLQKAALASDGDSAEARLPGPRQAMGKAAEKYCSAPDMLSEESLRMLLAASVADEEGAWRELDSILCPDGSDGAMS